MDGSAVSGCSHPSATDASVFPFLDVHVIAWWDSDGSDAAHVAQLPEPPFSHLRCVHCDEQRVLSTVLRNIGLSGLRFTPWRLALAPNDQSSLASYR